MEGEVVGRVESVAEGDEASPHDDRATHAVIEATASITSAAKWIVASFAGVGAALLAGVSLTDLGALSGGAERLALTFAGAGVVGVLMVIVYAARVLASRFISLAELKNVPTSRRRGWENVKLAPKSSTELRWVAGRLVEEPELRSFDKRSDKEKPSGKAWSLTEFIEYLESWQTDRVQNRRDTLRRRQELAGTEVRLRDADDAVRRSVGQSDPAKAAAAASEQTEARNAREECATQVFKCEQKEATAQNELEGARPLAIHLRALAQYQYVKQRFDTSRFWIVIFAAVAAVGAIGFAGVAGSSSSAAKPTAVGAFPARVSVDLNPRGETRLASSLGPDCDLSAVDAVATARTQDGVQLIPVGSGCRLAQLIVADNEAKLTPTSNGLGEPVP